MPTCYDDMYPELEIKHKMERARSWFEREVNDLPKKATTPEQERLAAIHGTPYELGQKVMRAIGEISIDEALDGMLRYCVEWEEAGGILFRSTPGIPTVETFGGD